MSDYRELLYGSYRVHYNSRNSETPQQSRSLEENYRLQLGPYLPADKNARILDVGCGSGYLVRHLLAAGYSNVAGIDTSADQVDYCRRHALPVERDNAVEFLARATGSDLVLSTDVIEHLTKDEIIAFLEAIYRALKPGGAVVLRTGNASSIYGPVIRYIDFTHETSFTDTSLRQILIACGFTEVNITDNAVPFGLKPKRLLRWAGLALFRAAQNALYLLEVGEDRPRLFGKLLIAHARKPLKIERGPGENLVAR